MQELYTIIDFTSYIPPLILFFGIVLLIKNYKNFTLPYKILFIYLLLHLFNDSLSRICAYYLSSNLIFLNTSNLIELVCIYGFLKTSSVDFDKRYDQLFIIILLYNLYEMFTIDFYDFESFQTYSKSINCIFLLVIIIKKVLDNLKKEVVHKKIKLKLFLILFLSLGAVLNLPNNIIVNSKAVFVYVILLINMINYIVIYVVFIDYLRKFNEVKKVEYIQN